MQKIFMVVAYDISNDKRRARLHKRLKNFGAPVQYSVFECLLEKAEIDKMINTVNRVIRPRLDHVRYYYICQQCRKKITVTGRHEVTAEKEVIIV